MAGSTSGIGCRFGKSGHSAHCARRASARCHRRAPSLFAARLTHPANAGAPGGQTLDRPWTDIVARPARRTLLQSSSGPTRNTFGLARDPDDAVAGTVRRGDVERAVRTDDYRSQPPEPAVDERLLERDCAIGRDGEAAQILFLERAHDQVAFPLAPLLTDEEGGAGG